MIDTLLIIALLARLAELEQWPGRRLPTPDVSARDAEIARLRREGLVYKEVCRLVNEAYPDRPVSVGYARQIAMRKRRPEPVA